MNIKETFSAKWLHFIVFFVVLLLVYGNSFTNPFIRDDVTYIQNNDSLKHMENFKKIFTNDYFSMTGELSYRPLATSSYFLNYALWKSNIKGWRISNTFLHFLNVCILYLLINTLFHDVKLSFIGSLVFALHPINTESILGVSFNEELLFSFFSLLSIFFYVKKDFIEKVKQNYFIFLSCIMYILAVFSKETAIILPLLILVYDVSFKRKKRTLSYLFFLIISGFYLWIRFIILPGTGQELRVPYIGGSLISNVLTMSKVFITYLRLMILPVNLRQFYYFSISRTLDLGVIMSFLGILTVIMILYLIRKKKSFFLFLWIILPLIPVMNILPFLKNTYLSERYLYFSSMPASLLIAMVSFQEYSWIKGNIINFCRKIPLIGLIIFFTFTVIERNKDWKDIFLFCKKGVEKESRSSYAHIALGNEYYKREMVREAIQQFEVAIELNKNFGPIHITLGGLYHTSGQLDAAYTSYKKGFELGHNTSRGHFNFGLLLQKQGKYDKAIKAYETAIKIDGRFKNAYLLLSDLYIREKNYDKSIELLEKGISLNPNDSEIREKLQKIEKEIKAR